MTFFLGELSFQEYEKRVREADTDYSHVNVGKTLNTRETEIVDIDKMIDEMSDLDDLSGLSSGGMSDDSKSEKKKRKKRKKKQKTKGKRRRTTMDPIESDDDNNNQDNEDDDENEEKDEDEDEEADEDEEDNDEIDDEDNINEEITPLNPNELRNKMVHHLEEMRLARQKLKRSLSKIDSSLTVLILIDFHDSF